MIRIYLYLSICIYLFIYYLYKYSVIYIEIYYIKDTLAVEWPPRHRPPLLVPGRKMKFGILKVNMMNIVYSHGKCFYFFQILRKKYRTTVTQGSPKLCHICFIKVFWNNCNKIFGKHPGNYMQCSCILTIWLKTLLQILFWKCSES